MEAACRLAGAGSLELAMAVTGCGHPRGGGVQTSSPMSSRVSHSYCCDEEKPCPPTKMPNASIAPGRSYHGGCRDTCPPSHRQSRLANWAILQKGSPLRFEFWGENLQRETPKGV